MPRFLRPVSPLGAVLLLLACQPNRANLGNASAPLGPEELLRRGDERALSGQGPGAEQYFQAALEAGAPASEVYPRLVSVCLNGGRLSAALSHVETALEGSPRDARLLDLRSALVAALESDPGVP